MTMPDGTIAAQDDLFDFVINRPENRWPISNSLNGPHVFTVFTSDIQTVDLQVVVLLTQAQVTFWKLKYNGR